MVQNKNNKWVYKEVPHRKEKSPQPCGLRACDTGESNMHKEFAYLCESKGITAYRIAKDCGFSNVTLSDWKNKGNMPKTDKLVKIARYLGTTVEYLVTGEDPAPAPAVRISSEEESLLSAYRSLNTTGRKKAAEYVSDLAGNEKYTVSDILKKGKIG